jgi:hypothetical protein
MIYGNKDGVNMKIPVLLFSTILLSGCTVSIIQTDTHGVSDDVVDDTSSTSTQVDPNVNVPVKAI